MLKGATTQTHILGGNVAQIQTTIIPLSLLSFIFLQKDINIALLKVTENTYYSFANKIANLIYSPVTMATLEVFFF